MLITKITVEISATENDNRDVIIDNKVFIWNRNHGWTFKAKAPIWPSDMNLCLELTKAITNYNGTSNNPQNIKS